MEIFLAEKAWSGIYPDVAQIHGTCKQLNVQHQMDLLKSPKKTPEYWNLRLSGINMWNHHPPPHTHTHMRPAKLWYLGAKHILFIGVWSCCLWWAALVHSWYPSRNQNPSKGHLGEGSDASSPFLNGTSISVVAADHVSPVLIGKH